MSFRPQTSHFKPLCSWFVLYKSCCLTLVIHLLSDVCRPIRTEPAVSSYGLYQVCRATMKPSSQDLFFGSWWPWAAHTQPTPLYPCLSFGYTTWRRNQVDLQDITRQLDGTVGSTGFGWAVRRTFPLRDWQGL